MVLALGPLSIGPGDPYRIKDVPISIEIVRVEQDASELSSKTRTSESSDELVARDASLLG